MENLNKFLLENKEDLDVKVERYNLSPENWELIRDEVMSI
jgi:hypothetical protein